MKATWHDTSYARARIGRGGAGVSRIHLPKSYVRALFTVKPGCGGGRGFLARAAVDSGDHDAERRSPDLVAIESGTTCSRRSRHRIGPTRYGRAPASNS